MPIHERFATGTKWVLTVGHGSWPPGTVVTVQEPPQSYAGEDELYCKVSTPDGTVIEPNLDVLG